MGCEMRRIETPSFDSLEEFHQHIREQYFAEYSSGHHDPLKAILHETYQGRQRRRRAKLGLEHAQSHPKGTSTSAHTGVTSHVHGFPPIKHAAPTKVHNVYGLTVCTKHVPPLTVRQQTRSLPPKNARM